MDIKTIEDIRKERKSSTAEDFTPSWLVNQMISKLEHYNKSSFKDSSITFIDPACGNGNILLQVLKHKLQHKHSPEQSLSTIFGCDIMADNVNECRLRLLKLVSQYTKLTKEHIKLVFKNIVCTPLDKYPNGSLDYLDLDEKETFNNIISDKAAEKTLQGIISKNRLDTVSIEDDPLPVEKSLKISQPKISQPNTPKNNKIDKIEITEEDFF